MACSDCTPGNSTVIIGGDNVTVSGSGNVGDPFVINSDVNSDGDWSESVTPGSFSPIGLNTVPLPHTVRILLESDDTISLPAWPSDKSGSITLVITQGGGGGWNIDFAAAGVLSTSPLILSAFPGAIDVVTLFWSGEQWIGVLSAMDVV